MLVVRNVLRGGRCDEVVTTFGIRRDVESKDAEKSKKVMEAMLKMEKIDIEDLKQAYEQQ
jgi:hypothetical protein